MKTSLYYGRKKVKSCMYLLRQNKLKFCLAELMSETFGGTRKL